MTNLSLKDQIEMKRNPEGYLFRKLMELQQETEQKIAKITTNVQTNVDTILEDKIDVLSENLTKKIETTLQTVKEEVKGEQGTKGDTGAAPTDEQLLTLIRPLIPEAVKGEVPSEDELVSLIRSLIPEKITNAELLVMIEALMPETDTPQQIVVKLNTTKESVEPIVVKGLLKRFEDIYKTIRNINQSKGQSGERGSRGIQLYIGSVRKGVVSTLNFIAGTGISISHTKTNNIDSITFNAAGGAGLGDVVGPSSATDGNVVKFDGTTGKLIKDSGLALSGTNTGDETTSTLGATLNGASAATPNDADLVATAESSVIKKITWTNVKAFLKSYFDTLYQLSASKDATGGYAGLTLFKINFKNAANTFTSFFTNANTAARTYTFPDKDITVAGLVDITGTNSNTNTGDETAARIGALIGGAADATPNDTDFVATSLTAAGTLKKITWTNVKAFLKSYFDTVYAALAGSITQSFGALNIELGHASDTTIARVSAGVASVEGKNIALNGTSEVLTTGSIELGAASDTTIARVSAGVISVESKNVALNGTGETFTTGSIELGAASDTTLSRNAAGVLQVEGVIIPSISSTNTLTNKRITKRTGTTTSSATPTINTDNVDFYSLTAQTADITSFTTNLSGTPTEGQTLWIAITGTAARGITWGTSFEASTIALPTTTVSTSRLDVGFVWNTVSSKWRCVATC